jgi:hypothetical protein
VRRRETEVLRSALEFLQSRRDVALGSADGVRAGRRPGSRLAMRSRLAPSRFFVMNPAPKVRSAS